MAEQQGGYRKPATPAMVSGPGAFSQRTDGQPGTTEKQAARYIGGGEWGTNKAFNEDVVGAVPMAAAAGVPTAGSPAMPAMPPMPMDLLAGSEFPDEPLTTGVSIGDGAGPEVLQYQARERMEADADLKAIMKLAPALRKMADNNSASFATRLLLKRINASTPPSEVN
jgi:hypothetical protein